MTDLYPLEEAHAKLAMQNARLLQALREALLYVTAVPPLDGWGMVDERTDAQRRELIARARGVIRDVEGM